MLNLIMILRPDISKHKNIKFLVFMRGMERQLQPFFILNSQKEAMFELS